MLEHALLRVTDKAEMIRFAIRKRLIHGLTRSQSGQSLVEYALILAFVALAVIVAMQALQPAISGTFNHVTTCLNSANGTSTITGTTTTC